MPSGAANLPGTNPAASSTSGQNSGPRYAVDDLLHLQSSPLVTVPSMPSAADIPRNESKSKPPATLPDSEYTFSPSDTADALRRVLENNARIAPKRRIPTSQQPPNYYLEPPTRSQPAAPATNPAESARMATKRNDDAGWDDVSFIPDASSRNKENVVLPPSGAAITVPRQPRVNDDHSLASLGSRLTLGLEHSRHAPKRGQGATAVNASSISSGAPGLTQSRDVPKHIQESSAANVSLFTPSHVPGLMQSMHAPKHAQGSSTLSTPSTDPFPAPGLMQSRHARTDAALRPQNTAPHSGAMPGPVYNPGEISALGEIDIKTAKLRIPLGAPVPMIPDTDPQSSGLESKYDEWYCPICDTYMSSKDEWVRHPCPKPPTLRTTQTITTKPPSDDWDVEL